MADEPIIYITKTTNAVSGPTADAQKNASVSKANVNLFNSNAPMRVKPSPGSSQGSVKLVPTNTSDGPIDIVNKYQWTTSKFKEEVPRIRLVEYQITQNQQAAYINDIIRGVSFSNGVVGGLGAVGNIAAEAGKALWNIIGGEAVNSAFTQNIRSLKDPYEGLYGADKTGFEYIFPFYSTETTNNKVSWSSKVPPAGESLTVAAAGGILGAAIDRVTGSNELRKAAEQYSVNAAAAVENINAPFAGIEQPMYYNGTQKNTYNIKFPLFNTITTKDLLDNYNFVRLFTFQNLHLRSTFATYQPPVFYKLENDPNYMSDIGTRPAVYVSNFTVQNVGALRAISVNGGKRITVPEAYMINITLAEMITTSRNIYSSIFTGESINVSTKQPAAAASSPPPVYNKTLVNPQDLGSGPGLQSLPYTPVFIPGSNGEVRQPSQDVANLTFRSQPI